MKRNAKPCPICNKQMISWTSKWDVLIPFEGLPRFLDPRDVWDCMPCKLLVIGETE